jgi:hypothetical protein
MADDPSESTLRQLAREKRQQGALPGNTAHMCWAGPGSGQVCCLCDRPIQKDHVEYEMETRPITTNMRIFRFHELCYRAWRAEC